MIITQNSSNNYSFSSSDSWSFSIEKSRREVTKTEPCVHCGKPDWCYVISSNLSVCNRSDFPADGWFKTSKTDKTGRYIYALEKSRQNTSTDPVTHQPKVQIKTLAKLPSVPDQISVIEEKDKRTLIYPYGENYDVIRPEEKVDGQWQKINKAMRPRYRKGDRMIIGKGSKPWEWQAYRLNEALQYCKNKWILIVEGEKCVEVARPNG